MGVDRAIGAGFQVDDQTIGAALVCGGHGVLPAFAADDVPVSHDGMRDLTLCYAGALLAAQVRRGQRVGVHLPPSADRMALCAAIVWIGAVVVPLGTSLPQARLTMALQGSGTRLVIHEPGRGDLGTVLTALRHLTSAELKALAPVSPDDIAARARRVQPEHPAVVLYGEGAQDTARGVVLSHLAVLAAARGLAARYAIGPGSRVVVPLSLNHAARLVCELAVLIGGATLAEEPAFSRPASHVVLGDATLPWPTETAGLHQPGMLLVSGDNRRIRAWERALPHSRIYNSYIRAELGGIAICSDPRDPTHTAHTTMGRPLKGVEVMIVDPCTSMDMLLYEIGEIWIRGSTRMLRYHDDLRASRRALDSSGFFKTGDMGYLDSEGRVIVCRDAFAQI